MLIRPQGKSNRGRKLLAWLRLLLLAPCGGTALGQVSDPLPPSNAVYLEVGGPGVWSGVHLEHKLLSQYAVVRAGVGATGMAVSETVPVFPLIASGLIGRGRHKLEVGAGVVVSSPGAATYGTAIIGLRVEPRRHGLFFRQSVYFLWDDEETGRWLGFAFGYAFR